MMDLEKKYLFDQIEPRTLDRQGGRFIILYFYPKDMTSGCTMQAEDLRDHYEEIKALGAVVVGVSRDSVKRHAKFKEKYDLPYDLIADTESELCQQFDVLKMKSMYGRTYEGIERSTFLLDESGKVLKEWRKVPVKGHALMLIEALHDRS